MATGPIGEFIPSQRGTNILSHNGYSYHFNYTRNDRTYWKCEKYKAKCGDCPATAATVANRVVSTNDKHNHPSDLPKVEAKRILGGMMERAAKETLPLQQICAQMATEVGKVANLDPGAIKSHLPTHSALLRRLVRQRRKFEPNLKATDSHTRANPTKCGKSLGTAAHKKTKTPRLTPADAMLRGVFNSKSFKQGVKSRLTPSEAKERGIFSSKQFKEAQSTYTQKCRIEELQRQVRDYKSLSQLSYLAICSVVKLEIPDDFPGAAGSLDIGAASQCSTSKAAQKPLERPKSGKKRTVNKCYL